MALAFELPDHLPRSGKVSDTSTSILTRISQTSYQSLDADLAASWLAELDSTIHYTKSRISSRIQNDFPAFERQLKSSTTVQAQLHDLSDNTSRLDEHLNSPNTGILPVLLQTLSAHEMLAEQTRESDVIYETLSYLLRIQEELRALSSWVQQGELSESAQASRRIHALVHEAPSPLDRAEIMTEIKKKYRTLNDRVQELLGDAYNRCIMFSASDGTVTLTILASTTVPPTSTDMTLPAILRALTSDSLSTRLSLLRRDAMTKLIEPILLSMRSINSSTSGVSSVLTLTSSSSSSPLRALEALSSFLDSALFSHLPPTHSGFPNAFHAPIMTALLTHLIKPSIPSSLSSLLSFLDVVDDAVRFEEALLPMDVGNRPIQSWAADVVGHYERKRREDVLQRVRQVTGGPEDDTTISVEATVKVSGESHLQLPEGREESGWDFEGEGPADGAIGISVTGSNGSTSLSPQDTRDSIDNSSDAEDASDGWGWGDDTDEDAAIEASRPLPSAGPLDEASSPGAEDDPWGDDNWETQPTPANQPNIGSTKPTARNTPKLAKRLEKFSAKAKGLNAPRALTASPSAAIAPKATSPSPQPGDLPQNRPVTIKAKKATKETYHVSVRAITISKIAEELLGEGQELQRSNTLSWRIPSTGVTPGQLLIAAAPLVLDLHRALYPIAHSSALARDEDIAMRWANDCGFLSDKVTDLCENGQIPSAQEKWAETGDRLKVLGNIWFEDVVARQQDTVKNILMGARGFVEVARAERFGECKTAISQVLREITSVARQWRVTLTRSAYLHAVGQVVDEALFRVLNDVLSLADIPEADSELLSELCEMLATLEEPFTDGPGEQSVVGSYVSLWFKFSYLPWLLKGSIADLSYLFDQGMLVDYKIDELVRLLRALFAETPLRENTIAKISKGHPIIIQHQDF